MFKIVVVLITAIILSGCLGYVNKGDDTLRGCVKVTEAKNDTPVGYTVSVYDEEFYCPKGN